MSAPAQSGSQSNDEEEAPSLEAPSFGALARMGSMQGGRAETGSLDKDAEEGPMFSAVKRGGVGNVARRAPMTSPGGARFAGGGSSNDSPRLGRGQRPAGASGMRVPDALKELEFDGVMAGASSDAVQQQQRDAVSRVGPLIEALDNGGTEDKAIVLFEMQQILPQLHRAQFAEDNVIRQLCARLVGWPHHLQETAAGILLHILGHPVAVDLLKVVCETAFEVLDDEHVPVSFFETWGDVLIVSLPKVSWERMELQKLLLVLDGKRGETRLMARKLTARLLGFLAVDEGVVRELLLSRAVVLAEEQDVEIRGMIAESLGSIGAVCRIRVTEKELWPTITQFVQDEDVRVLCAAMKSIAHISIMHKKKSPQAPFFTKLLPALFLKICTASRSFAIQDMRHLEDDHYLVLEINSIIFGKLITSCFQELPANESRKEVYKSYLAMCTANSPAIRRHCAYNLPGVAKELVGKYRSEVSALVGFFSNDADAETRWNLAAGLHETIKILASRETVDTLYTAVRTLLQDSNGLVRLNTLQHFNEIVTELARQRGYASASRLSPLFENLHLQCQGNWRTQELLAKQLGHAVPLVPPPTIEANILPLLYKLAAQSAFQVRKASMLAIAACIRHLSDTGGRETAMAAFQQQWAQSPVYWMRMGFVDSAEAAVGTYSRILFRDTFAAPLLRLAQDPISNVRLRVAKVLEKVAPATHQMEEFHTALTALVADSDVDVQDAVVGIQERVECVLEMSKGQFEDDLDREEEEQNMYARHLEAQRDVNKKKNTVKRTASVVIGRAKEIANSQLRSPTQGSDSSPGGGGSGVVGGGGSIAFGPDGAIVQKNVDGASPNSVRDRPGSAASPSRGGRGFRSRQKQKLVDLVSPGKTNVSKKGLKRDKQEQKSTGTP